MRWSVRIDANPDSTSLAVGISTLTCDEALATSRRCMAMTAGGCVDMYDATGLWWIHDSAHFRCEGKAVSTRIARADFRSARQRAVRKDALSHYCSAGRGDAGLELHFEIDLSARTLQLQLNHPPDSSPPAPARPPAPGVAVTVWTNAHWNTHARAARLTPSEVVTVPLPSAAVAYRPALMLWGPITVSEIEPPAEFPLTAQNIAQ
jgi:hypothetical protein